MYAGDELQEHQAFDAAQGHTLDKLKWHSYCILVQPIKHESWYVHESSHNLIMCACHRHDRECVVVRGMFIRRQ
jgi:hypothetical protein